MDAAVDETVAGMEGTDVDTAPEQDEQGVDYVKIRIPVRHIQGMHTVKDQKLQLTPRQARAQRMVYDGMAYSGEEGHARTLRIGTTAPIWHATAWLLDQVADAYGMDRSSLDTLA